MLKFLFLILLLGLVFFLLGVKHSRPAQPRKEAPEPKPKPAAAPQEMASCAQCGLHLPAEEALPGRGGLFCSASHRKAYEAEHGGGA